MKQEKIWREFAALSPEMQRQVLDFITFLRSRSTLSPKSRNVKRTPLREESFVGMWRGRRDMRDSTKWVREIRKGEWMN